MRRLSAIAAIIALSCGCNKKPPPTGAGAEPAEPAHGEGATAPPVSKESPMNTTPIPGSFEPQVAGQFYTADPRALRAQVLSFIDQAASKETPALERRDVVGIIAPHAGFVYSGPVAGEAYRAVAKRPYRTVVVMALSHRKASPKIAMLNRPGYDTPLGPVAIDQQSVVDLVAAHGDLFDTNEDVFIGEHSLEVQLPFIQVALPGARIIPIIAAVYDQSIIARAAEALFDRFGDRRDVLFVASTDLTHFMPYDAAVEHDTHLLALLDDWRIDEWKAVAPTRKGMCGFVPVLALVEVFSRYEVAMREVSVLDYRNSGDTAGKRDGQVVGYGAVAFSLEQGLRRPEAPRFGHLDPEARRYLMDLARRSVRAAVRGERFQPATPSLPAAAAPGAAFVTLKKGGRLRGCIGSVVAKAPLFECIADVATAAAVRDTRFSPVTEAELDGLEYEISVLTPPERTTPEAVVVGRDGLIVSRGGRSGLLLPQVPVEWQWNRETFLSQTCRKAGLPEACWEDPETRIERFEAIVFGEGDLD